MSRKAKKKLSFFKVLSNKDDFPRLLRLPRVLLKKYGSILPANVKLRIRCGRTWGVKVEEIKEGVLGFTRGWHHFIEDVGLKFGEFLVFDLNSNDTFDVSLFETNTCEKEFPAIQDSDSNHDMINKRRSGGGNNGGTSKLDKSSPLYFEIKLKPHHLSRISLNTRFLRAADLMGKESVGLEYVSKAKQYYKCALDHRGHTQAFRIDIAEGWRELRKANGLILGKTYSFQFKPNNNVIQVKEVL